MLVIGTINFDIEDGEQTRDDMLKRLDQFARIADAASYIRRLPLLFGVMNTVNFIRRFTA